MLPTKLTERQTITPYFVYKISSDNNEKLRNYVLAVVVRPASYKQANDPLDRYYVE